MRACTASPGQKLNRSTGQIDVCAPFEVFEISAIHAGPASDLFTAQAELLAAVGDPPGEVAGVVGGHDHLFRPALLRLIIATCTEGRSTRTSGCRTAARLR